MKLSRNLAIAAIAFGAAVAQAQTSVSVEYDFHKIKNTPTRTHYWAAGVSHATRYGIVDGLVQGSHNRTLGAIDNVHGLEIGYSYPVTFGRLTLAPRVAVGTLNGIDVPGGQDVDSRYLETTLEARHPIMKNVAGFAAVSHTKGLNADAVQSSNRVTAGVDYSLTKNVGIRLGLSHKRQLETDHNGVYTVLTYSLGK